ncbi:MAG: TetR/AcrR family transcriptional regulator [Alphaproteobacteria bacterium]|nr:TetR/AcrR family transcriptional regulator [Alphaproteobacteria bacterium]
MKRGRPRKTDPETALHAAMKVFWDRGYEGTSMSDLVDATGMAKPGLYANFGDKEALYAKALTYYYEELGAPGLVDLATSEEPINVVVRRFLENVARAARDKEYPGGCFVLSSVVECGHQLPALETLARSFNEKRRMVFIRRFRIAEKQGQLPAKANTKALAESFSGQSLALGVLGRGGASQQTLNDFIDVAMTVLD